MAVYHQDHARPAKLALTLCVFLLPVLASCGGNSPAQQFEEEADPEADTFVDWAKLDYKFMRLPLASAYFFDKLRLGDAYRKYREQTWYTEAMDPVTLAEFRQLSGEIQDLRQEEAHRHYRQAMRLQAVIWRGWEKWTISQKYAVAAEALVDEMGVITPAIEHLKMATGLDPSNPVPWYDLAYFAGTVGDRTLQRNSLEAGLAALDTPGPGQETPPWLTSESRARLRLRLLLDTAWSRRDEGYFSVGLAAVQEAINQMAGDDLRTLAEAREALLLQALLMVDLGQVYEARQLARSLPTWKLPLQKPSHEYFASAKQALVKENLEQISSDFAKNWVWIMTFLAQDEKEQALARMSERNYLTEFPPHLNHRFWRDMGTVLEHFGERADSRLAYGFSILYHPYFPYFPLHGARGISRVVDQTGCGETYYLGYQNFYISGSYYSFAANRIVAMEMAEDSTMVHQLGMMAVESLSTCIRRGLHPASSLALRGRAWYRLDDLDRALADLTAADAQLSADGRESSEVIKTMAVIHFEQEDFQACLDDLERYVERCPDEGIGWRISGLALANLSRFDEAVSALERSLRVDPGSVQGWYNLALVRLHQGEVEPAQELLAEASERFPENLDVARLLQLTRDNPDQPIRMTSSNVELQVVPETSYWFDPAITVNTIDLTAKLSKAEAEQMLPKLWQQYSQDPSPQLRLTLARTLAHVGRTREVQELLGPLWRGPLSREEAVQLLLADRDQHTVDRALQAARALVQETKPFPDGEFWTLVASICLENGQKNDGQRALALARKLDPDNAALQNRD